MKQRKDRFLRKRFTGILCFTVFFLVGVLPVSGQEVIQGEESDSTLILSVDSVVSNTMVVDSIPGVIEDGPLIIMADTIIYEPALPDSTVSEAYFVADSVFTSDNTIRQFTPKKEFKPNSTKAVIYSAIFPGLGQIYNRKYWKLPLVYGGYMGFLYAITWNNRMYQDYYNGYMAIMYDVEHFPDGPKENWNSAWTDFIPRGNTEEYIHSDFFQSQLKRRKDYYRRYRDLSIILAVGFYAICMIDAYVDAELFDFDISPDLSMRIEPLVMPRTAFNQWSFGLNYCITF